MDIPGIDLNLLGPLIALLEERHVSRAAERAHMSQPAMSRTLRKLRVIFDDELLLRAPGGYRLTPRAERLQRELAVALPQIEGLFSEELFDPFRALQNFRLAGNDYLLSVVGRVLCGTCATNRQGQHSASTAGTRLSTKTSNEARSTWSLRAAQCLRHSAPNISSKTTTSACYPPIIRSTQSTNSRSGII